MFAIHLCAPNDKNGNPRRFFLVVNEKGITHTLIDEGYEGINALKRVYPNVDVTLRINIPASYYNEIMKIGTKRKG